MEQVIAGGSVERHLAEHWSRATVATLGGEIVGVAVLVGTCSTSSG